MGLVLDSGVLIAAEREARPVSSLLATLEHEHGETEVVLSSITVMELEHGLHRAQTRGAGTEAARVFGQRFRGDPGATALHFGYSMGTRNARHFRMLPNLNVIQL